MNYVVAGVLGVADVLPGVVWVGCWGRCLYIVLQGPTAASPSLSAY